MCQSARPGFPGQLPDDEQHVGNERPHPMGEEEAEICASVKSKITNVPPGRRTEALVQQGPPESLGQAGCIYQVAVGMPAWRGPAWASRQSGPAAGVRPKQGKARMMAAQNAIGSGLVMTACQRVSTACNSVARRSSSSGMATTLDAKMGAAIRLPSVSQFQTTSPSRAMTTWRKNQRRLVGTGASKVMRRRVTQPGRPAPARVELQGTSSRCPFCSRMAVLPVEPGLEHPPRLAASPRSARLSACRPVASAGHAEPDRAPPAAEAVVCHRKMAAPNRVSAGPAQTGYQPAQRHVGARPAPARSWAASGRWVRMAGNE